MSHQTNVMAEQMSSEVELTHTSEPAMDDLRESQLRLSEYHFDDEVEIPPLPRAVSLDGHFKTRTNTQEHNNSSSESVGSSSSAIHFRRGESETIRRVLEEVEVIALKRTTEGFNEVNFSLGVLNCFLVSFMVGAFPEHLWLLYIVESAYMIPRKFYNMWHAKPLNQALYYLDFCWCMNFIGILFFMVLIASSVTGLEIDEESRMVFYNASVGISCGVLMTANVVLPFVACLFHDVNTMTGLFIHLMPPMVAYTFRWHADKIVEAWPSIFSLSYAGDIRYFSEYGPFFVPGFDSVVGTSIAIYLMWWAAYVTFMLLGGINLPRSIKHDGTPANPKFDTVFHSTMRQGICILIGKYFHQRPKTESLKQMEDNCFDTIDFLIYMAFHMIGAMVALFAVGYPCFKNKYVHGCVLAGAIILAVVRGAQRYTYYSTRMYSKTIRKQFADVIADDDTHGNYTAMKDAKPEIC